MIKTACTVLLCSAASLLLSCGAAARSGRSAGLSFAFNEFSAAYRTPLGKKEMLRTSLNLDMTRVISGKSVYPGLSADVAYLFVVAEKRFASGESIELYAGPGVCAGYVRNTGGNYGVMAALEGCVGFDYVFNVPFSIGVSIEPGIGLHLGRDSFGTVSMDFYKAGMIASVYPHVNIRYRF